MFTGIIEEIATVRNISDRDAWLDVSFSDELKLGQSVACDGVCLTVVEMDQSGFRVELLEETKRLTSFYQLGQGSNVNVERAMKADDRFDGHIVQAHSEGVAVLCEVENEKVEMVNETKKQGNVEETVMTTWLMTFEVPSKLMKYMILKGIIILNGIALTLTSVDDEKAEIQVAIIPHTWDNTNLQYLKTGDKVNLETDVLAKYVERMVTHSK
jgi:riboflavin synthase